MSGIQWLNRLALIAKIENLSSRLAGPCSRYHIRFASTKHRDYSSSHHGKVWQSIPTRPLVSSRPLRFSHYYSQHRANHASGNAKIEKFLLPDIGEGIKEVVIKGWQVKVGDVVKEFDPICEVESDKATATISSRYDGTIKSIHYEVGDMASVGKPLVDIEVLGVPLAGQEMEHETQKVDFGTNVAPVDNNGDRRSNEMDIPKKIVAALPSVRRFAQEMKVDLDLIKATGSRGQVLRDDILAYLDTQSGASRKTSSKSPSSQLDSSNQGLQQLQPSSSTSLNSFTSVVPLLGVPKVMFKTMTESLKIPHFNYADEIDLTQLIKTNSSPQSRNKDSEAKKIATFAYFIKMVSLALKEYPQLNASIDENGENLIHKHYHNIGVAVDTKAGLLVPNIKNVQNLSVEQVNSELIRLRELGYASSLSPADLSGATITLSNIGAIGGTFGVPVIVSPEIVIGALGRIQKLPRYNSQDQLEARHILQIVWSADHRVVDGATLSRFSNLLKSYLESPHLALLKLT